MAYRGDLDPLLFKSQELPMNNCLRVKDEEAEKRMQDFLSGNKLMDILTILFLIFASMIFGSMVLLKILRKYVTTFIR